MPQLFAEVSVTHGIKVWRYLAGSRDIGFVDGELMALRYYGEVTQRFGLPQSLCEKNIP